MRLSPLLFGLALGAGSVALTSTTQAIVGPSEDNDDRAAVLVEIETADGDPGTCTGVVIAPRAVLTAAHCVAPQAVGANATFSIFLGDDPNDPEQTSLAENHVAVVTATPDPDFDLTLLHAGHDVAVLATRTPLSVAPLAFEPPPPLDDVDAMRVVGFGITALDDARRAERRREATIPLASYDAHFLELGLGDSAPCLGDSGGPAFAQLPDGGEALAGIVSYTDAQCGPFARVTRLGPYLSFLQSAIEESEVTNEVTASGGCAIVHRAESSSRALPFALLALLSLRRARLRLH